MLPPDGMYNTQRSQQTWILWYQNDQRISLVEKANRGATLN